MNVICSVLEAVGSNGEKLYNFTIMQASAEELRETGTFLSTVTDASFPPENNYAIYPYPAGEWLSETASNA